LSSRASVDEADGARPRRAGRWAGARCGAAGARTSPAKQRMPMMRMALARRLRTSSMKSIMMSRGPPPGGWQAEGRVSAQTRGVARGVGGRIQRWVGSEGRRIPRCRGRVMCAQLDAWC